MTDSPLDRSIRQALLAAAEEEFQQALAQAPEGPSPSPAYQRWARRLLKDPLAALQRAKRPRPMWKQVLRTAACILLMLSLSLGTLMAMSPDARAWVSNWFVQSYSTNVSYQYTDDVPTETLTLGKWAPTYLPEGYAQTESIDLGNQAALLFNNNDPEMEIELDYQVMVKGDSFGLDNEHHEISNITIHTMSGQLFTATDNSPNMLVWFNESAQHAFLLVSKVDCDTLIRIAESVVPVK